MVLQAKRRAVATSTALAKNDLLRLLCLQQGEPDKNKSARIRDGCLAIEVGMPLIATEPLFVAYRGCALIF
jgi:hypothetical protein